MHDESTKPAPTPAAPAAGPLCETALALLLWGAVDRFASRVRAPVLHKGWIYATNGKFAVRVPTTPTLERMMEYCEFGTFGSRLRGSAIASAFAAEDWDDAHGWAPLLPFPRPRNWTDDGDEGRSEVCIDDVFPLLQSQKETCLIYDADFVWPLTLVPLPVAKLHKDRLQVRFAGGQALVMGIAATADRDEPYVSACETLGRIARRRRTALGENLVDDTATSDDRLDVSHLAANHLFGADAGGDLPKIPPA